jgi:hypothetical protein
MMGLFDRETTQLEAAAAQLERDRAGLLRSDGQPRYVAAEHTERMAAALARFNTVADAAEAAVERQAAAAAHELTALTLSDPLDRLSADEQQRASVRAVFVREDVAGMPLDDLTERCRALLTAGSKIDQVLWARYARRRLDTLITEGRAQPGGRSQAAIAEAEALRRVLEQLDTTLADPKAADRRAAAEQTQRDARAWSHTTHRKRIEADGRWDQMLAAARSRISL